MSIVQNALMKVPQEKLVKLINELFLHNPQFVYNKAAQDFVNDPEVLAAFKSSYPEGK